MPGADRVPVANEKKNAFVVWLDPGAEPGQADRYQGRIEHVPTSTRETFSGKEELLAFIERHFGESGSTPSVEPSSDDGSERSP